MTGNLVNLFQASVSFLYPLKTSENLGVFRGCNNEISGNEFKTHSRTTLSGYLKSILKQ